MHSGRAVANGPAGPVLAGPVFTKHCTYFAVKTTNSVAWHPSCAASHVVRLSCRRPLQSLSREMQSALC